jgi:nucleotide-binding universal stress UspA family protein
MKLQRILVGVDFSPESDLAIAHALELAKEGDARLILAHVLPLPADLVDDSSYDPLFRAQLGLQLGSAARERATEVLQDSSARCRERGVEVESVLVDDNPSDGLARVADELGADLLVVGTHGRTGLKRFLLGSVAERAVRLARVDALVARPPAPDGSGFRRILVASDFSAAAGDALSAALAIAPPDASIEVVHCWQTPVASDGMPAEPMRDQLAAAVAKRGNRMLTERTSADRRVEFISIEASPAEGLRARAEEKRADLIVIGSHGHRGVRRFLLGSVAETVVRHAPCSVLVVHPAETAD